ncbi:MAG: hypothetical protein ACRDD0_10070 [Bacteroidales bacterium]
MKVRSLHLELTYDDPAFSWVHEKEGYENLGKLGTYMNGEFGLPKLEEYELIFKLVDCREQLPSIEDIADICRKHDAIMLYTGTMEKYGYTSKAYQENTPELLKDVVEAMISLKPHFILVDAAAIDKHSVARKHAEKMAAEQDCFIINNVNIDKSLLDTLTGTIKIEVDETFESEMKPCKVYQYL